MVATYSKLVKTGQDFALGIQSVNGARDNLEAFHTAWTAEHGDEETPAAGQTQTPANPYEGLGRHDTPPVPRAVVSVQLVTFAPGQVGFTVTAQPTVLNVTRLGVGQWFIAMDPHLPTFWANAFPLQSSADIFFCRTVSYFPAAAGSPAGVVVSTYSAVSGADVGLFDIPFTCTIYGYDAAQATPTPVPAAPMAMRRSLPPWSPRTAHMHPGGRRKR